MPLLQTSEQKRKRRKEGEEMKENKKVGQSFVKDFPPRGPLT